MNAYDATLVYREYAVVPYSQIDAFKGDPTVPLRWARERIEARLAPYPGTFVWEEDAPHAAGGIVVAASKYPPAYAARLLAKRAARSGRAGRRP